MVETTETSERRTPELIDKALRVFEDRLIEDTGLKPTLAEYLKLLQWEKELAHVVEGPREITVTWVEPEESYSEE